MSERAGESKFPEIDQAERNHKKTFLARYKEDKTTKLMCQQIEMDGLQAEQAGRTPAASLNRMGEPSSRPPPYLAPVKYIGT